MEVRIRNIDPAIVTVIDEYAKENNESRNEYVKRLLHYDARRKILEEANRIDEDKIKPIYLALEIMMNKTMEMSIEIQKMIALNIYLAELDEQEVHYLLDKVIIELEEGS